MASSGRHLRPTDAAFMLLIVFAVLMHTSHGESNCSSGGESSRGLELVEMNWSYVSGIMIALLFLLSISLVALICHHLHWLAKLLPETCLLILLGLAVAAILVAVGQDHILSGLTSRGFMLFLLPPIVLDAAYNLNSRIFAENIGLILTQAVLGTLVNFAIIGPSLYGLALTGIMGDVNMSLLEALLFASFIVAVDPVAVIAIFKDVGVNDRLYFLVFGESLLNDAITLVLYNMMSQFILLPSVPASQIAMGVALFLVDSFGGFAIGLALGLLSALIVKITYKLPSVEPMVLLTLAYISYLLGQLFEWSSIIALTTCGIVQAQLCFPNMAFHSYLAVTSIASEFGSAFEAIVFLFLGAELMRAPDLQWNVVFIVLTIALCLAGRAISIFGLTGIRNLLSPADKIGLREQLITWFGGLRGALAFALCSTLGQSVCLRTMFLATTLVVIMFTVFLQGILMRPLVLLCKIEMKNHDSIKLMQLTSESVVDNVMFAVEVLTDQRGTNYITNKVYKAMDAVKQFMTTSNSFATNLIELVESAKYQECCSIRDKKHSSIYRACHSPCCFRTVSPELVTSNRTHRAQKLRSTHIHTYMLATSIYSCCNHAEKLSLSNLSLIKMIANF